MSKGEGGWLKERKVGFFPEDEAVGRKVGGHYHVPFPYPTAGFPSALTLVPRTRKETRAPSCSRRDEQAYLRRRCPW